MIGTIRWNLLLGAISFVVTLSTSLINNIWSTALIRSCYSFVLLFLLVFLVRWILGSFAGIHKITEIDEAADDNKGTALDMTTPDEDESLNQLLKDSRDSHSHEGENGFAPLNPPKLSRKVNMETGDMVQALRQMSDE
ncbi:hypothetical protein SAMN03159341_106160 [Paenibacillus sp. 1_12]|uniref:hypothetical protein n=1 Tax=Paenibacillus sp. 1_12 TaxID=1566278 RepID=UPI0008DFFFE3|nr:hypothetical protein [Paenibacillus sp. 1_12]SFL45816.1 hypothetical protein SAMN03159341_106160 [Paenibacillus sp. 1_12]